MHASVTTGPVQSGKWDELVRLYEAEVLPLIGGESGMVGAYLIKQPVGDEAMSIALYETEDQAIKAGSADGLFTKAVSKLAHTLARQPERSICEVVLQG